MKYKSLTDYIAFFENKDSVFSKTITETFDTNEPEQNAFGDEQTIRPFHEEPQLFADVEYDYNDGYAGVPSEYSEKGARSWGKRFYCKGSYNPTGKCTVKYTVAAKQLDSFIGAIYACFLEQNIYENADQDFDEIESPSQLNDSGHSFLMKVLNCCLNNKINFGELSLELDEIKDFLLSFANCTLSRKLEICKSGVLVPVLHKLKELDVGEHDYLRVTHYIKFTFGSCWSVPLNVIIKRSYFGAISIYKLREEVGSWPRVYKLVGEWHQEQFDEFLKKLKAIHTENWEHDYGRYPVTDATGWSYCQAGEDMEARSSSGYMIFPDNFDELLTLFRSIAPKDKSETQKTIY